MTITSVARLVAVLVLPWVLVSPALAEMSKPFPITALVVNGCSVVTDGSGRWGTIDLGTTPGAAGATIQSSLVSAGGAGIAIDCTPGVSAALAADGGDNAVAGGRFLKLAGGTATIPYQLYADGSSTPWTTGTVSLPFTPSTGRRLVPVRSVATLSAPTPAGTYTDTVRVTLTW